MRPFSTDSKDLLTSKTTWGVILTAVSLLSSQLGIDIGDPAGWTETLIGLAGTAFALYGRITAVHRIGSVAGIPTPNANA